MEWKRGVRESVARCIYGIVYFVGGGLDRESYLSIGVCNLVGRLRTFRVLQGIEAVPKRRLVMECI